MTTKKVYLAGPIAGLTHNEATYSWRKQVYDALHDSHHCSSGHTDEGALQLHAALYTDIHCYSPMRGKKFLAELMGKNELGMQAYHENPISTPNAIVGRDRDDVRTADLVFMNLLGAKAVSMGTTVELGWADAFRVPVVLCMEEKGNPHDHMFFKQMATWRVFSIEEGINIAKHFLLPGVD